jgi:hypothetical protein
LSQKRARATRVVLILSVIRGARRFNLHVIAPSKARRLLRGASPRRVRVSCPPVSSVGPAAEWRKPRTILQGKRTQSIL